MKGPFSGNTIFIIFLVIMAFNAFRSGRFDDPGQWLLNMLLLLPAIVIGITFHEAAHAYSAYKLGDQTPKVQGRVTLNPLKHIDPIGIIVLIFVGFGWGRPVQVNPYAFTKNRRLANIIVDISGVVTNLILAFVFAGIVTSITLYAYYSDVLYFVYLILINVVRINLVLMLFNLLPVPPLDGFGIITELFDLRRYSWHKPLYNGGMFILLALIIFGVVGWLLGPALATIQNGIYSFWYAIL